MSTFPLREIALESKENVDATTATAQPPQSPAVKIQAHNHHHNNNSQYQRLERLYTEQLNRTQQAQHEQERLEVELLMKDKQLLESQTALKKANETNRRMAEKFHSDAEFLEQEMLHYKAREATLLKELETVKADNLLLKRELLVKDNEMTSLNEELEEVLMVLQDQRSKTTVSEASYEVEDEDGDSIDLRSLRRINDDDEEGDDTADILIDGEILDQYNASDDDDDDYYHDLQQSVHDDSLTLTSELNRQIEHKDSQLKKLQFEIQSLKHEKTQLYTYVNKLLKNQQSVNSNDILKQKLVHRKILRAVSVNPTNNDGSIATDTLATNGRYQPKRRVMSNFVNLKSYKYDRLGMKSRPMMTTHMSGSHYSNNSDEEREEGEAREEDLLFEKYMLGYHHTAFGSGLLSLTKKATLLGDSPLHKIFKSVLQTNVEIDLTVD